MCQISLSNMCNLSTRILFNKHFQFDVKSDIKSIGFDHKSDTQNLPMNDLIN